MSEQADSIEIAAPGEGRGPGLAWEVPEVLAAVVLLAVAVLAAGGLAAGISLSVSVQSALPSPSVWSAVQFGSQWADPLVALVLLGVLGVCWWQLQAWAEVVEEDADGDRSEALGHMRRARLTVWWAVGAFGVTAVGSIAEFASTIGQGDAGVTWPFDINGGAGMSAVLLVAGTGALVGRHLNRRYLLQ